MKIAVTAHGEDRQATVDCRFGRANYFVLYDQEKNSWDWLANMQNREAAHGAGIQAAQKLSGTGTTVLLTGRVGPKAFKILQAEQIAMYSLGELNCTAEEALSAFLSGNLAVITAPNALDIKK